jgi:hypothetical protein
VRKPAGLARAAISYANQGNGPRGASSGGRQVLIALPHSTDVDDDIQRMQRLHAIFKAHRGSDRLVLLVRNGRIVTRLEPLGQVAYSDAFRAQVEGLLGEGAVQLREE